MNSDLKTVSAEIYTRGSSVRAALALAGPVLAVLSGALLLVSKNYNLGDYFLMLFAGELNIVRQGVGWLALGFWIARYWAPAFEAITHHYLLARDDQRIVNGAGQSVRLSEVTTAKLRSSLLRKEIEITANDGSRLSQSVMFSDMSSAELLEKIRADASAAGSEIT